MAPTSWISVAVFLQPVMAACFFPAAIAALSMVRSAKERGTTIALTFPIAILVGGGVPMLIGFISDFRSFGWGIALVGGLILTGSIFVSHSRGIGLR